MLSLRYIVVVSNEGRSRGLSDVAMPKVAHDPLLQKRLQEFVDNHGNVAAAARMLGVDRATLWRFLERGMARIDTRQAYSAALEREAAKSETSVAVQAVAVAVGRNPRLEERELRQIRRACEGVLALLNAYEGR